MRGKGAAPTHWRVIRLALITDRGSPCDASLSAADSSGGRDAGRRRQPAGQAWLCAAMLNDADVSSVAGGLNPAPSFIVHLLSRNEPFGTRTATRLLVLRSSSISLAAVVYFL